MDSKTPSLRYILVVVILLSCFSTQAQWNLHTRWNPVNGSSQLFQPAHIHAQKDYQVNFFGGFWLGNNEVNLDPILSSGNYISNETKNDVMVQLSDEQYRLHQGLQFGGIANLKIKEVPISISYQFHQGISLQFQDSATLGLVLRGNAVYAGQTIQDQNVYFQDQRYTAIGIGSGWKTDKFEFGFRVKAILGHQIFNLRDLRYTLFTEQDGSTISLNSTYDWERTPTQGLNGGGVGVDAGFVFKANEKLSIQGAIQDLGWISWSGDQFKDQVDVSYEGVSINDLLDGNFNSNELLNSDSLLGLIFPDTVQGNFTSSLPAQIFIAGSYQLQENQKLHASISMGLSNYSPAGQIPVVAIGYQYLPSKLWEIGTHVYAGGIDQYGWGLSSSLNLPLGNETVLQANLGADNLLGLLLPSNAKGISIQASVGVGW